MINKSFIIKKSNIICILTFDYYNNQIIEEIIYNDGSILYYDPEISLYYVDVLESVEGYSYFYDILNIYPSIKALDIWHSINSMIHLVD